MTDLADFLRTNEKNEVGRNIMLAIAGACVKVSSVLRTMVPHQKHVENAFGDDVLNADLEADKIIARALRACPHVATFASEENPTPTEGSAGGTHFVAFDPLDGSSIIPTNFSVGSIFGVWPGGEIVGKEVGDQCCSLLAVYGPRTTLFVASRSFGVYEFILRKGAWKLAQPNNLTIAPQAKLFAPGNLRTVKELPWYRELVESYMMKGATLRYTGGMVPDVTQILVKGNGIFMTPRSAKAKMKLRVCFECGPIAFMMSCADGASTDGEQDYLKKKIEAMDQRSAVAVGSCEDVAAYQEKCAASLRPSSKL